MITASLDGHLEVVRFLADRGADIRVRDDECVHLALAYGHLEVARFLVERGADIRARIVSTVRSASASGHLASVRYLVEECGVVVCAQHADNCLSGASRSGNLELVQYLVGLGANILAHLRECVIEASASGSMPLVQYLVELGADISGDAGGECMAEATRYGRMAFIRYAVENVADYRAHLGICIYRATGWGHEAITRYLVGIGADIYAENSSCARGAILMRDEVNTEPVIRYLIALGADLRKCRDVLASRATYFSPGFPERLAALGAPPPAIAEDCARAARRVYFWWVPRGYALRRRSGRRLRKQNCLAFLRLCAFTN